MNADDAGAGGSGREPDYPGSAGRLLGLAPRRPASERSLMSPCALCRFHCVLLTRLTTCQAPPSAISDANTMLRNNCVYRVAPNPDLSKERLVRSLDWSK